MQTFNKEFIYLDYNATTPIDPEVTNAMLSFLGEEFGNPSSSHILGQRAKEGVEISRQKVASLIGCKPEEVLFTSGGSESNNCVLKGLIDLRRPNDFHIITSAIEHPAVINPALYLMEMGVDVTVVPVTRDGLIDPGEVQKAIKPKTALISIMLANNETGTLEPIKEISEIAESNGVAFHTDAAQAVGKIPVNVDELGVDFLSIAGHKLYGPKGVGALYIREGRTLVPLIHGAGQEGGRRAGTENVILCSGLGAACEVAKERLEEDFEIIKELRDLLQDLLINGLEDVVLNGHSEQRLPNTLNVSIPGLDGNQILDNIPKLFASTGAACHDRSVKLSHVLSAMGVAPEIGMGALRLTLGRGNTREQIEEAGDLIIKQVKKMRKQ